MILNPSSDLLQSIQRLTSVLGDQLLSDLLSSDGTSRLVGISTNQGGQLTISNIQVVGQGLLSSLSASSLVISSLLCSSSGSCISLDLTSQRGSICLIGQSSLQGIDLLVDHCRDRLAAIGTHKGSQISLSLVSNSLNRSNLSSNGSGLVILNQSSRGLHIQIVNDAINLLLQQDLLHICHMKNHSFKKVLYFLWI